LNVAFAGNNSANIVAARVSCFPKRSK
jgi:hypothetical protein